MPETVYGVIVDHADRLHESITDRRPDELEAAPLEILAERLRRGAAGRDLIQPAPAVDDGRATDELPDIGVEGTMLLPDFQEGAGVDDGGIGSSLASSGWSPS